MDTSLYGFDGLHQVYNVHPVFIHFPIALFPVTLLFYALGLVFRKQPLLIAGRICLYLTALSGIAAIVTGLIAQDTFPHNERIHHMMETHRTTGLIILALTVLLTAWSFWQVEQRPKRPSLFLLVTAIAVYFVLQNGDLGSRMVYVEGAAVKPAASVMSDEDHEHNHSQPGGHHHHQDHPAPNHNEHQTQPES
jgi:uncharacterized membrane protein